MSDVITPVKTEERVKLGIRPGDTVRVHQKIVEFKKGKAANKKETTTKTARIQVFEGLVLAVKHGTEAGATFTVRATMSGVGVEKIFPLYAPFIEKIEIVRRSKVRRAKLYFIREKVAREVRRQLRNMRLVKISTTDFAEEEKPKETEVTVEEVRKADPMQKPDGTEAAPAEEEAGAPEAPEVEEAVAAPEAETGETKVS
ncbi:MAG: large subunit ribosomal protein [Candidatus Parcubacteria bacterium]|jgi:large subunit ribosomal protein L19|nr:large subunit ribosomal protein [Candidatus Parcubacteria bacterium]